MFDSGSPRYPDPTNPSYSDEDEYEYEYDDDDDPGPNTYSAGLWWGGFHSPHQKYASLEGRIYWRKDTPSTITSHPKTQFDRLPPEILHKILSYVTKGYACSAQYSISGFHEAWPGSYYAWLTEPMLESELCLHSYYNSAYQFKDFVDSVVARPQLRHWKRYLNLQDDVHSDDPGLIYHDAFKHGEYDAPQTEAVYLRNAAARIFGDVDPRLVPRVGKVFDLHLRVRMWLYLLPNIELLKIAFGKKTQEITGWPSFNTVLRQYRDTLASREHGANLDVLQRRLAVEKYLASSLTSQHEADEITPFLSNVKYAEFASGPTPLPHDNTLPAFNLLRAFFLPKICLISGKQIVRFRDLEPEYRPEINPTNSNHKHDAKCWKKIDPHCLAPLFGTSPVTILMFENCILSSKLGCFLRLPKGLSVFSYKEPKNCQGCGFHIGDLAWGLDPHQDSLEVLEVAGYDHISKQTPSRFIVADETIPYVAAGFSPDRIHTLRTFRHLREVNLQYWMLTGEFHDNPEVSLTNFPESLEILSIEFSLVYPCKSCLVQDVCPVQIRHLVELLQRKDELFPKLKKLEVVFDDGMGSEDRRQVWESLEPAVMAAGLESFRLVFCELGVLDDE